MGMIGRYLDSLTDEQRDRVIEHPDPTYGGTWWREDHPMDRHFGCACLVGTAENAPSATEVRAGGWRVTRRWLAALRPAAVDAGYQFPVLTDRFGAPRIWALVKARAAKGHSVPTPARETVGAA